MYKNKRTTQDNINPNSNSIRDLSNTKKVEKHVKNFGHVNAFAFMQPIQIHLFFSVFLMSLCHFVIVCFVAATPASNLRLLFIGYANIRLFCRFLCAFQIKNQTNMFFFIIGHRHPRLRRLNFN